MSPEAIDKLRSYAFELYSSGDEYDALLSKRRYKGPWSHEPAKETIAGDSTYAL